MWFKQTACLVFSVSCSGGKKTFQTVLHKLENEKTENIWFSHIFTNLFDENN